MKVNVKGYIDRRTPALLGAARAIEQAHADNAVEEVWRQRVAQNEARRWMRAQELPGLMRRQGN